MVSFHNSEARQLTECDIKIGFIKRKSLHILTNNRRTPNLPGGRESGQLLSKKSNCYFTNICAMSSDKN